MVDSADAEPGIMDNLKRRGVGGNSQLFPKFMYSHAFAQPSEKFGRGSLKIPGALLGWSESVTRLRMFEAQQRMTFEEVLERFVPPALKRGPGRPRLFEKNTVPFKSNLCSKARRRGRDRGMEAMITADDLIWPSHCPVLGIELDYPSRTGERRGMAIQPNWPSLDRWDSTKGYVPGNVFVISYRANTLKNAATYEEILKVAKYLSRRPR
jgi:hypothetical protein